MPLAEIESLYLSEDSSNPTVLTDAGLGAVASLASLLSLNLSAFWRASESSWSCLQNLNRLKQLELFVSPPFDLIASIGQIDSLEVLKLRMSNSLTASGMAVIQSLPKLESLELQAYAHKDHAMLLDQISSTTRLKHLTLKEYKLITDSQLGQLANMKQLESLHLFEASKVGDKGILQLNDLKSLRSLVLDMMPKLSDQTLMTLSDFSKLERVALRCNAKMTVAGYSSIAKLKNLKILHLEYARQLTSECLAEITENAPLQQLYLMGCPLLTDDDWKKLTKHPTLTHLSIQECTGMSEDTPFLLRAIRPDWHRAEHHSLW